ncbi:dTDP-4-dehydrorhamnose 3,5-epimerase [Cohnella sp. GCM10012308]|uniref:dTDP-4-dehydrorhamnose 3,5-epimerase n=1 Tax=Cohnella sp. GCM10012308 TaxID=3317329 RepID=UPI0036186779
MNVIKGKLEGVLLIEPKVHEDHRGFFMESYNYELFIKNGIDMNFIQDNHSLSVQQGVIRGMHYQLNPRAQTKLVRVVAGSIWDVVVDIRRGSPTFGRWEGFELSAANKRQLLVPKGFAHGFCTLTSDTQVIYKVDELYSAEHDRGILWNDPKLNIEWPFREPVLSEKDRVAPPLDQADYNFIY